MLIINHATQTSQDFMDLAMKLDQEMKNEGQSQEEVMQQLMKDMIDSQQYILSEVAELKLELTGMKTEIEGLRKD